MIDLRRDGDVFVLTMDDDENRWTTAFTRAFTAAVDEVEASDGPAALVTTSSHPKFFSNGLDVEWIMGRGDHAGGDRSVFGAEYMALMGRILTLPIPTIAAVNGHAFGAGFMLALTHDVRLAREDRGYLCANELEIGLTVPPPEVALFKHKLPAPAFHETVLLAKRWTAPAAVASGFVEQATALEDLLPTAIERARQLAPLAAHRENLGWQKEQAYGTNAALNQPHGAAHMLRNATQY
ncbi:MAG: enoyl-CoA hydratase/isomerase family protein [Actinomycetota bacterium]